jgi:hypothetical protein
MGLRTCGSFKSANHNKDLALKSQNPQNVTFAEGSQI